MSVLSLLTSVVLVGLVYGLSFLPTATLNRSDDDAGFEVMDDLAGMDERRGGHENA